MAALVAAEELYEREVALCTDEMGAESLLAERLHGGLHRFAPREGREEPA
jgi:hypothetical protein